MAKKKKTKRKVAKAKEQKSKRGQEPFLKSEPCIVSQGFLFCREMLVAVASNISDTFHRMFEAKFCTLPKPSFFPRF